MANYTLCLLVRENLSEGDRNKVLQEISKNLPDPQKPEVISWGKRDLAYPILKETQAFYYLVNFEADSTTPGTLDKKLKLDEAVLRFLIIKRAKKATKAPKETKVAKVTKEKKEPEGREETKVKKVKKAKTKGAKAKKE